MGTNYYLRTNICECCNRYDEVHIGKSSAGWSFTFHGMESIRTAAHWAAEFAKGRIFDEYGDETSVEDFWKLVEAKRLNKRHADAHPDGAHIDPEGHSFSNYEFS